MASVSSDNEKSGGDQAEMVRLLCRALSRLAVAAHGIDRKLDEQLAELRQLLRRDIDDLPRLDTLVNAIDARIKHVDEERDRHAEVLQQSLQKLIEQLLATKPPSEIGSELKTFLKLLKRELPDGEQVRLLTRLPILQARVIDGIDGAAPRGGMLSRWFNRGDQPAPVAVTPEYHNLATEPDDTEAVAESVAAVPIDVSTPPSIVEPISETAPITAGEPPFARISTAVCEVLSELLQQIDPPPMASDDYRHAREQIAKGLNWYELVSTLEQISMIVLAALERDHGEFQQFLEGINQRLQDAHGALESSRASQSQRVQDDAKLNEVVRFQVAELNVSVQEATQLDSLKAQIATRLESVVGALDVHKESEEKRQQELEQQLVTLTERLREMESQSTAIEQRLIEQQRLALLDMLTQLPNRQAYEQRLHQEYERWKRYGRPLALAVCDIDHFKKINDNFGHLSGDKVLRVIAKTLAKRLRKTDFIARFGGEEFVILMPETDQQAALQTIETIREAVANCPFHFREKPLTITLSAGIAVFAGDASTDQIFERADTALYQAKQNGRNRCEIAG